MKKEANKSTHPLSYSPLCLSTNVVWLHHYLLYTLNNGGEDDALNLITVVNGDFMDLLVSLKSLFWHWQHFLLYSWYLRPFVCDYAMHR